MKNLLLILLIPALIHSTQYTIPCDRDSIQHYHDNIISQGDTINVQAGTDTFTTRITISTGCTILGVDTASTSLVGNIARAWDYNTSDGSGMYELGQMKLTGDAGGSGSIIDVTGDTDSLFIHNIKFLENGFTMTMDIGSNDGSSWNGPWGLIYNCHFTAATSEYSIFVQTDTSGWDHGMTFGTDSALYIEDCLFDYDAVQTGQAVCDGDEGGRVVFRYNTVYNDHIGFHGACNQRSFLQFEIYENTFENTAGESSNNFVYIRGGTGYIYNNTFTGTVTRCLKARDYNACGDAQCDYAVYSSYPGKDQIGRGSNQDSIPVYEYNNTLNGGDVDWYIDPCCTSYVQLGRDMLDDTQKPGYTAEAYPHKFRTAEPPAESSGLKDNAVSITLVAN